MKTTPLLVALIFTVSASTLRAEEGWIDLIPNNLDAFRTKPKEWMWADKVGLNPDDPRQFTAEPGKAILVNVPKKHANDLYTKQKFADLEVMIEFCIPKGSNSGIKFHEVYEIQIYDSFGKKKTIDGTDCGGIYPTAELLPRYRHLDDGIAPLKNASKAPGEWQTLHVIFRPAKFDATGKKVANAMIELAELNGEVVHKNQEMKTPTGHNKDKKEVTEGELMIQGDHGPVAFRVFKVRPLAAK